MRGGGINMLTPIRPETSRPTDMKTEVVNDVVDLFHGLWNLEVGLTGELQRGNKWEGEGSNFRVTVVDNQG